MIQKLQRKILLTIFAIFTTILLSLLIFINFSSYRSSAAAADRFLKQTLDASYEYFFQNFQAALYYDEELSGSARFYIIRYESGNASLYHSIEPLTETLWETLSSYTDIIMQKGSANGSIGSFRYMTRSQNDGSVLIVFLNVNFWNLQGRNLLFISLLCFLAGLPIFALISFLLSRWLIIPVAQGFERQEQFISDASHELKTPLAVISANADVLENEVGPNKWLSNIQAEIKRTSNLINSLLLFTKIDAQKGAQQFEAFDLSQAVLSVLMPFECVAYEKEVTIEWNIPSEFTFWGDEEQIKQLTTILADNAINHAYPKTAISVSLKADRHKLLLIVTNRGDTILPEEQERIFERFYRIDKARNRKDGHYGLGLAIAKRIVEQHHGDLYVQSQDNITTFTARLPL